MNADVRRYESEVNVMDEINVHVYTSGVHNMKHKQIVGHFLVECIKDGNLYTYPPEGKTTMECWENATPARATAYLLTRAVNIVNYYLGITQDVKKITVYMEQIQAAPFINHWPEKWEHSGYLNKGGLQIQDRDVWEQYNTYMHKLDGITIEFTTKPGSFQSLMIQQAQNELKRLQSA